MEASEKRKIGEKTMRQFGEEIIKLAHHIGALSDEAVGLEINFEMSPSSIPSFEVKISRYIMNMETVTSFTGTMVGCAEREEKVADETTAIESVLEYEDLADFWHPDNPLEGEKVAVENVREYDLRPDSDVYYYIDNIFGVSSFLFADDEYDNEKIESGNFFETRAEAEEIAKTIRGMIGKVKVKRT